MPADGKPRVSKCDGAKEKQCANRRKIRHERHGDNRGTSNVAAGEGRGLRILFLQGGNSRSVFCVRARALHHKAQYPNQQEGKCRGAEDFYKVRCAELRLEGSVNPKQGICYPEKVGDIVIKKNNRSFCSGARI